MEHTISFILSQAILFTCLFLSLGCKIFKVSDFTKCIFSTITTILLINYPWVKYLDGGMDVVNWIVFVILISSNLLLHIINLLILKENK